MSTPLPTTPDDAAAGTGAPKAAQPVDTRTQAQIEADIARTRAELRATVDELSERLNPRNQAQEAVDEAKVAFEELKRKLTGEVRPADEPEPTRRGWIVLGAAAAVAAAVVGTIARKL
ncbi:DUF3618 domain-containing protein [Actinotalea fermentans]|uniref:DUF3618 domain-containing protein n=1 Tax=Actinotalea fermentans TaxID=43671 RepID=A0A511YYM5_9CELL|nr:DUF3618 domain-containing protein [Actinotalea fermentans]KGM15573.1 hypothetical protein N867_07325 [Actinotalea fermentans ATCC 43279 = JCM 9966 = DSM 3133]GEN80315.1 hypothetical protein AFE02nite_20490 [Actinotalea fermentans]